MVYHDKRLNVSSSSKVTVNGGLLELKTDLFYTQKCIYCLGAHCTADQTKQKQLC